MVTMPANHTITVARTHAVAPSIVSPSVRRTGDEEREVGDDQADEDRQPVGVLVHHGADDGGEHPLRTVKMMAATNTEARSMVMSGRTTAATTSAMALVTRAISARIASRTMGRD